MPIVALFIWPFITITIFRICTVRHAIIYALLLGYLFLPEAFAVDISGLPAIDKGFVIAFSLLITLILFAGGRGQKGGPNTIKSQYVADKLFYYLIIGLICLFVVNNFLTIADNRETLNFGGRIISALRPWDMVSAITRIFVFVAPFFIARRFLSRPEDHRLLLKLLVVMGLIYTIFILVEVRLSPQLHAWVYGYHQHSFFQHIRGGAYRPKVFLEHGLSVGIFLFMVTIAAFALSVGAEKGQKSKWMFAGVFLFGILVLSRNSGATLIAMMVVPLFLLGRSMQLRFITAISIVFLTFPALRQADLVPVDWITQKAATISESRAQSFDFRIQNENILLDRAAEKPVSGWGGWGRARVYNDNGTDISVTDGLWIIILGTSGWLGYIAFFGLLVAPLLFLRRVNKRKPVPVETAGLALIMIGVLIYLIPNSALSPIGWLIAGALAGFVQYDTADELNDEKAQDTPKARKRAKAGYTRYPPQPIVTRT